MRTISVVLTYATVAVAQELSGTYCLLNTKSGGYLNQDKNGGKISNVQVWSDCKSPESQWKAVPLDGGRYALQNMWSKNWLNEDVGSSGGALGDNVHVWTDNAGLESQWTLEITVATERTLKNARTGYFLTQANQGGSARGDHVEVLADSSVREAHWTLQPAPSPGPGPSPGPSSAIKLHVNDKGAGTSNSPFLSRCVGSGHAWLGMRKDWQDQLATVRKDLGTEFVRFHGLLDDDMGVYQGPGKYNFTNVDIVYDFLVSIGMRPIVEVSFMPAALARGSDTGFYPGVHKCRVNPPSDYDEWGRLIGSLGSHFVKRYGEEEVSRWFFEVWNEPNCGFFKTSAPQTHQCCATCADMPEYMKLYKYTAEALKGASSKLRVGGPATAQLGHVDDFIKAVQEQKLVGGEVITSHIYPTDPMTTFLGAFESIAASVRKGQNFTKTYILSEFNSGLYGDRIGNHDRAFAAAFLVSFAADVLQKKVDIPRLDDFMASYWTFSDIFEEQGFPTRDFQNGFGMITTKGVPKPAYRALQLLNFGEEVLKITKSTSNANGADRVKAVALRSGKQGAQHTVRVFISNLDEPSAQLGVANVTLSFDQTPHSAVVYRIDGEHTNPRETWEQMGSPDLQGSSLAKVMGASTAKPESLQPGATLSLDIPARACVIVEVSWSASSEANLVI